MQGSLYQFIPHEEDTVRKLLSAAYQKVIIAEPSRDMSASNLSFLAALSRRLTAPDAAKNSYSGRRFDRASLTEFFTGYDMFERSVTVPGGREMIGIFRGLCRD